MTDAEHRSGEDMKFTAEGFNLRDLPLSRAIEYLQKIAQVIGGGSNVHIEEVRNGSLMAAFRIASAALPGALLHIDDAIGNRGSNSHRAYEALNEMLGVDGGRGVLRSITRDVDLLIFPGKMPLPPPTPSFYEESTLRGELKSLDRTKGGFVGSVRNNVDMHCFHCGEQIALELRSQLWNPVEVSGRACWQRMANGQWKIWHFDDHSFQALN